MDIEARLTELIRPLVGREPITRTTRLLHDLDLSGDDVVELLTAIADEFGADMTGMEFEKYFPNETEGLGEYWGRKFGLGPKRPAVTVGHLMEVVEQGRWFDPTSTQ